jgi:hypothetical protein
VGLWKKKIKQIKRIIITSVARARAANVSIIKLIHNICTAFSGSCSKIYFILEKKKKE